MPGIKTAGHLCTPRRIKATKTWWNCCWPARPTQTPGTKTVGRLFTLRRIKADKDVAELLLANKAKIDAKANGGYTPLHFAASVGYKDVAELLASRADVNARDKDGWTPLHYAAANGYEDVTNILAPARWSLNRPGPLRPSS